MWQEIIVGICVVLAVLFAARRYLPFFKSGSGGCGGCSSGGCKDKPTV